MLAPGELILNALSGIYTSELIGLDLTRIAPARIADHLSARIQLDGIGGVLQDAGTLLAFLFGVIFLVVVVKLKALSKSPPSDAQPGSDIATAMPAQGPMASQWQRVLVHLDSPREADWKLGVMEADKLADAALAGAGYPGASLGERLMNAAPGQLASLDGLWWAHKIRNRLAHEVNYFLRYTEARQAVTYYEQALNELEVI
jgi:hypothetical protein